MKEKYLPIGTVVLLKDATKNLMITGYCSSIPEEPNVIYDYVAYLFPEGSLAGDNVALFNHDQIGTIIHMGLENEEFKNLDKEIKDSMKETPAPTVTTNSLDNLPPFTPENINLMLEQINKQVGDLKPVSEPTAFNEDVIKKPTFELPTLNGGTKKQEEKEEEEEDIPVDDEEDVVEEKREEVADGQPVLQLQPIFDNAPAGDSTSSAPATPASGGFSGLSRL